MKFFLKKELSGIYNSVSGYLLPASFLLFISLMLWVFSGEYNIPDSGYATLRPFFNLAAMLFLLFVPVMSMHLLADERRLGTLELLLFRPVSLYSIIVSKFLACFLSLCVPLALTLVYVISLYQLSTASVDWGEIIGGYVGLLCLLLALSAIGLFSSSLTRSQLVSFLIAVSLSFSLYFGFDLVAGLFMDGRLHNGLEQFGMYSHFRSFVHGVIDSRDVFYFLSIALLFLCLTYIVLSARRVGGYSRHIILWIMLSLAFSFISFWGYFRLDLTADRRYTLSDSTCRLVMGLKHPLQVRCYLNGDLNPAFHRLRTATVDMLEELALYAPYGISMEQINPSVASDEAIRQDRYMELEARGIRGISVNEHDREGKFSSRIVFPWLELIYGGDTLPVRLLGHSVSQTPQQVLNGSMRDLEFTLSDGLRVLTIQEPERVAFIEGHDELTEPYVWSATDLLSRYYQVDRGSLQAGLKAIMPYKVLIIAGSRKKFTDEEKFVLDQYLMQGGRLFFLLDGVVISDEAFSRQGESPTLKSETGLDDLLFTYGVRINPVVVQDMSCIPIRLRSTRLGMEDTYSVMPWYFAPLLEASEEHLITKHISPLKSELVSTLSWVGNVDGLRRTVLLTTSGNAHTLPVPEAVSLRYVEMPADAGYFNEFCLPVAGLLEGVFPSAYRHRKRSGGKEKSEPTRLLVCATASVIRNEWQGNGADSTPLPLGYEPVNRQQLGNADFVLNAVNYLAGHEEWLNLRGRHLHLRLLNREQLTSHLLHWQLFNVLFPVLGILLCGIIVYWSNARKRYTR